MLLRDHEVKMWNIYELFRYSVSWRSHGVSNERGVLPTPSPLLVVSAQIRLLMLPLSACPRSDALLLAWRYNNNCPMNSPKLTDSNLMQSWQVEHAQNMWAVCLLTQCVPVYAA